MRNIVKSFIFIYTGALFYWALSGFKGSINDFLTGPYEYNSLSEKNYITGVIIIVILVLIGYKFHTFYEWYITKDMTKDEYLEHLIDSYK